MIYMREDGYNKLTFELSTINAGCQWEIINTIPIHTINNEFTIQRTNNYCCSNGNYKHPNSGERKRAHRKRYTISSTKLTKTILNSEGDRIRIYIFFGFKSNG